MTGSIARYEFKYLVRPTQLPDIRRFLSRYCVPDEHSSAGGWYPIRSLYLDNARYQLYRDTEESAPHRFKLRVRGYGDGAGPVKLEVKQRSMDLIVKTSATLSAEVWRGARHGSLGLLDAHRRFAQLVESLHAVPRMLVEYERQAYSSLVDDYVRITFDRRMRCQPAGEWNLAASDRAWRGVDDPASVGAESSLYVMELKFALAPPEWLRDLVRRFDLSRRGYSKYGRAVRRWVMEGEAAWDLRPARRVA